MPGRSGWLHASLPLRRNAGANWPPTAVRPCRDTGALRAGRAAVRPPDRSGARERPGGSVHAPGIRERVHDLRSEASRGDMQSTHQSRPPRPYEPDHNALETSSRRFPIPPPQLPRPFASLRPPTSALLICLPGSLSQSSCSSALPACRRPASGLPPSRLGCPARCLFAGRGRGVQREAVDPPSSKAQA